MADTALARNSDLDPGVATAPRKPVAAAAPVRDFVDDIFQGADKREKFIPVTAEALIDRLTRKQSWPGTKGVEARRFFNYLTYWRQQSYAARLIALAHTYEPFSPDSDLLITRTYTDAERLGLQKQLMEQMHDLLRHANYVQIDPAKVGAILTKDSHYGLDLQVDLDAFDELAIYFRGATKRTETRRNIRKLYLKKEEFDVPIFQRLCVVFKLKAEETRLKEIMAKKGCDREAAEKAYKRIRGMLPPQIKSDFVYVKLFKNMPRSDIEMAFPNTTIKFRTFDKLKLGATAGGGIATAVGTAGKLLVATNPVAMAGAAIGLCGIAVRQFMGFVNQRNKYMVTMAQNLYFHAMADNRGVMTFLAERAAEEDVKEELLLYSILAKETVYRHELGDVDLAIESYMQNTFGVNVNFDIDDALQRLIEDGIVTEQPDGKLVTRPPTSAASQIDMLWDKLLDDLPDRAAGEGIEFDIEPDDDKA
ncbi:MAG: TMEM143 family protein [Hyphomicrobiaceae bacterium]